MKPFNEASKKEFLEELDGRLTLVGIMRYRLLDCAAECLDRSETLSEMLEFLEKENKRNADPDVRAMLAHVKASAEGYFE